VAYVRTVKTKSGATAVQIVHSNRRGSRTIDHIGSAHNEQELAALKKVAADRLAAGQGELDLGVAAATGPLPITSSHMQVLWDTLAAVYSDLGFADKAHDDSIFRDLVLARIIEPTSKQDSLRVLEEAGVPTVSYRTLTRRLPRYATPQFRQDMAAACAARAGLGPASLILYDVTTLYFETDKADGFREPGFSKERRLEPQITVGLLTDATGFPLMIEAFEGNRAETATMLPTLRSFMAAHDLDDITVVADAGMISDANKKAIEAAGLSFILGEKIPTIPYLISQWHNHNPDSTPPDGLILTQPYPCRFEEQASRSRRLLPVQRRPSPAQPTRDRRADGQSRESRRGQDPDQAQPVRQGHWRRQEHQPRTGH
jgi:hypothetical protein